MRLAAGRHRPLEQIFLAAAAAILYSILPSSAMRFFAELLHGLVFFEHIEWVAKCLAARETSRLVPPEDRIHFAPFAAGLMSCPDTMRVLFNKFQRLFTA